jgi:hypothetical protein
MAPLQGPTASLRAVGGSGVLLHAALSAFTPGGSLPVSFS